MTVRGANVRSKVCNSWCYFLWSQHQHQHQHHLPKICPRSPQYIPKICPIYAQYMPRMSPRCSQDAPKISPRYAQYIPNICPISINFHPLSSIFIHFHNIDGTKATSERGPFTKNVAKRFLEYCFTDKSAATSVDLNFNSFSEPDLNSFSEPDATDKI